jgi:YidC/Oxa1 family membrane protein insertase
MIEKHPYNAYFPSHGYYTQSEAADNNFVYHSQGTLGGYYPLLRRDVIEKDARKSVKVQPRYYGLNIVSEYPETAELIYEVKSFTKDKIVFEAVQGHRRITKEYSVASESQAPYSIDLVVNIQGDSRGLWLTSGVPEVEWISGAPAPALKYRVTRNQKSEVENIDLPKDSTTITSIYPDWITNSNGFFGLILDPLTEIDPGFHAQVIPGTVVPSRLVEVGQEHHQFDPKSMPGYMMRLPLKSSGGIMHFRVFAGPFASSILKKVDETYSNPTTGYNPDYIASQSFHGWFAFISEPFAKFLFILMNFFHTLTGSWAFSIILLTVALRIMLYPLNAWSTKSMLRMQQIAPEVTAIQEKYKKDPKKGQLEILNLYRERGVNPVSGCLPLLIQMPFLIGMFDLLKSTFELRGASFIPGWIDNLTAPDVLFSWETPIFFIGNQFHLLPILLGLVMFFQQRMMSPLPKDQSLWTEQQRQQRFMGNIMTIVFAVMFYHFPSGLNIYWLSSMLLGMLQQYWTTMSMNKEAANASVKSPVKVVKGK